MNGDPRPHMIAICHHIYARQLSDSAGGNLSVRMDGRIYLTPRYMGSTYRWDITPELISVLDLEGQVLEGPAVLSRESRMHLALYQAMPRVGAVIHAHPRYIMAFACAELPLEPTTEYTRKFGTIGLIPETPAKSPELARRVVEALLPQEAELTDRALAVMLPYHGIAVAGRDLDDAYDTLERLAVSARVHIYRRLLE
jgi:ribulose-5-phosphate 4-epimerase/fuculose-1-phosphate aldolase